MKIDFKAFLDSPAEIEALGVGFAEVICPWKPRFETVDWQFLEVLWTEHHYYLLGRAAGVFTWLGIIALFVHTL